MDIVVLDPQNDPLNPSDPEPKSQPYSLTFLADGWEWDVQLTAETVDEAKAAARLALEALVRDEKPALACVYLLNNSVRVGVWDWVERQCYWTVL